MDIQITTLENTLERVKKSAREVALSGGAKCPDEFLPFVEEWNREYYHTLFELDGSAL